MIVKQFYDKGLAHGSYAIESSGEVALIDPGRDPQPYIDFAEDHNARIIAVLETHPHADFASSHLEFHEKYGATIYVNPQMGVAYPHKAVGDGDEISMGQVVFKTLFTPGHSPDHNSYLLLDENGMAHSVFTGDSLFVGDVGRPDLREGAGNLQMQREGLAKMMFDTVNNVFKELPDHITVYPAHGAGSLCGKNMSTDTYSTIGREKSENWAFQVAQEADFVKALLEDQPFIPKYFPYDVDINRNGLPGLQESIMEVPHLENNRQLDPKALIIDTRPQQLFKAGHIPGAINLQDGGKFETWLGSIVGPTESFYIIAQDVQELKQVIGKTAKIGYETLIKGALVSTDGAQSTEAIIFDEFKVNPERFTIVDIRNLSEFQEGAFFDSALNIPLPELRERVSEIPADKPVVVHCAGGYRSAAGASIVSKGFDNGTLVYDLGEHIKEFQP